MRHTLAFTALVLIPMVITSGCGDPDLGPALDVADPLACGDGVDEIVALLRSGMATFDDDPAPELAAVVERSTVVVTGTIESVVRRSDESESWAEVGIDDVEVVGPAGVAAPAESIAIDSGWGVRGERDPLESTVAVDGVEFVALLHRSPADIDRYRPDVQGFAVGCRDTGGPTVAVIEPLPPDAAGLTVAEIAAAARAAMTPIDNPVVAAPGATAGDELPPLWRAHEAVEVVVDGRALAGLTLNFDTWDGESVEPVENAPAVGVVIDEASTVRLEPPYPAEMTTRLWQLDGGSTFIAVPTPDGSFDLPAPGTWFVDVQADFGPSDSYGGVGTLRTSMWLHVTAAGAPCGPLPAVAPVGPDAIVGGLVDADGCPAPATVASLDLWTAWPGFHCAPWSPILRLGGFDPGFWRDPTLGAGPEIAELPDDVERTGVYLPAGEILTTPDDGTAIYVDTGDGAGERWSTPIDELGCA